MRKITHQAIRILTQLHCQGSLEGFDLNRSGKHHQARRGVLFPSDISVKPTDMFIHSAHIYPSNKHV